MTMTPTRLRVDLCLSLLLTAFATNLAAAQPAKRVSAKPMTPTPVCLVADFKVIGLENHEPQERLSKAIDWLKKNGTACTLEQAVAVSSNRASWMGNADSPALMGTLEAIIETKQKAAIAAATAAAAAEAARKVSQATPAPAVAAASADTAATSDAKAEPPAKQPS